MRPQSSRMSNAELALLQKHLAAQSVRALKPLSTHQGPKYKVIRAIDMFQASALSPTKNHFNPNIVLNQLIETKKPRNNTNTAIH